MKKRVFEVATVGGIEVKNRIIRSATQEIMSENGIPTQRMFDLYEELAKGEVGLIITGYFTFSSTDNHLPVVANLSNNAIVPALKSITDMVHKHDTKIVAQLAHLGSQIRIQTAPEVFAPSDVNDPYGNITPTPLSVKQIQTIVTEFGIAALKAKQANFDGVQIHGAHGYLLSKFLSPVFNQRDDEYGGNAEKRTKIVVDVVQEIKKVCGKDFPVWIKLNSEDFGYEDQSMNFEQAKIAALRLEENGIDLIELSGGTSSGKLTPARSKQYDTYHLDYAQKLSNEINVPISSVGGFRTFKQVEEAVAIPKIDAVSICRPLIREPQLIKRWMEGNTSSAACVACGGCLNPKGIACIFNLKGEALQEQKAFLKQLKSNIAKNYSK